MTKLRTRTYIQSSPIPLFSKLLEKMMRPRLLVTWLNRDPPEFSFMIVTKSHSPNTGWTP